MEAQRRRDLVEIPGLSMLTKATVDRLRQAGCEANVSSSIGQWAVNEIPLAAKASAVWSAAGP